MRLRASTDRVRPVASLQEFFKDSVAAAMAKQGALMGQSINYALGKNDCVSHVKDILKAGGLDVSSLPSTIRVSPWMATPSGSGNRN